MQALGLLNIEYNTTSRDAIGMVEQVERNPISLYWILHVEFSSKGLFTPNKNEKDQRTSGENQYEECITIA